MDQDRRRNMDEIGVDKDGATEFMEDVLEKFNQEQS